MNTDFAQSPVQLMKTREVAAMLSLCESTVNKFSRQGLLKRVQMGRAVWYYPDVVYLFFQNVRAGKIPGLSK